MKWAVDGCIKWQKEGLIPPDSVTQATSEYKAEMDMLAAFCEACITVDYEHGERIPATELFAIYSAWASSNNEFTMSSRKFFLEITKKLPEKKKAAEGIMYTKIKLTDYAKSFLRKQSKKKEHNKSECL